MQAPVFPIDLHALLQLAVTAVVVALGLIHLIKVTSSRYFVVDDNKFDATASEEDRSRQRPMSGGRSAPAAGEVCVLCGTSGTKKCSACKAVRYCSTTCQAKHWQSDHKYKCRELKLLNNINPTACGNDYSRRSVSKSVDAAGSPLSLVPSRGVCKELKLPTKVLFPYDEFVKLFNWDNQGFSPCGLLNCGNSCFVNVVLQCLSCTRPLVAYLLEKGHLRGCRRNDWCFLCELQLHVQRARQSIYPFSPINILSRLPNIGGNLGYGNQEDAHEFMRFAIDTMQSVCLDEFGGEKVIDPITQETTLINHIFGGHLESQVVCTKCDKVSHRYESMMDLTVEIQGDASCLEECLDQFTIKEQLDGDNMYKCDGCNDYVKAWKRLSVHRAPNILTIALKRFQGGRFGKLNKRVTFPETLDLSPYMSDVGEDNNMYNLYGVVVHLDMLNASFFGHYICYIKDFCGNWYRIDDCKVSKVDLEEVLGQAGYMLLYSRVHVRNYLVKPLNLAQTEKRHHLVEPVSEKVECMEVSAQPLAILNDSVMASTCDFLDFGDPCAESNKKNDFQTRAEPMDIDTTSLDSFNLEEGSFGQHSQTCEDVSSVQVTPPVDSLLLHEEPLLGDCTTVFEETTSQPTAVDDFHGEDQSEKTCGIDSSSQECPTDCNSTGDSINSKFEAIPSFVSEAPNEEQAIFCNFSPTRVEQDVVSGEEDENSKLLSSVTAEIPAGRLESNSQRDCRPLFSPGFLSKPGCKMPLNKKDKFIRMAMDIGDCHQPNGFVKAPTFCQNGREASELSPDLSPRAEGVDDFAFPHCYSGESPTVNDRLELLCEKKVNKHMISKKPILRPGFLNDQPKKRFLVVDSRKNEVDEKLLNYEVKNCNGFLDHPISTENGIMHHENGKLLYENDKDVQLN